MYSDQHLDKMILPTSQIQAKSIFRPEIEGLRALAVLSVLAFHHNWAPFFAGGFVGVDVFFVISGYLITRNIFVRADAGAFSFKYFYVRRIRRLFPAHFFTIAITLAAGILISSPGDLKHIGESAVASVFSASNFYFWTQAGYFDSAAIQKPLLHTWTLSVEEQFYLIWPVAVVLLVRYWRNPRHAVVALVVLGLFSTFGAEMAVDRDPSEAFYLMPYRMGEFALGAICAWLPERKAPAWADDLMVLSGLMLIFFAVFRFTETTRFPGMTALIPCLGTAMVIHFGKNSRVAVLLLANRAAVGIGRISYSLYLIHWPLYAFFRQIYGGDPGLGEGLAISAASMIIAMGMYKYIEQPFRFRNESKQSVISTLGFIKLFAALTLCLVVISTLIWTGDGLAWRFPDNLARFAQEAEAEKNARFDLYRERCLSKSNGVCDEPKQGRTNVLVIGDSHAADAFNALAMQYSQHHYMFSGMAGCPPLVREDFGLFTAKHPNRDSCIERNESLLYGDRLSGADLVVINTVFSWYKPEHLAHTIRQIRTKTSAPIVVFGNYLFFNEDVPDMIVRHGSTQMDDVYSRNLDWHSLAFDDELEALSARLDFTYISKKKLFCRGDDINDCPLIIDDKLFTYDRHHLSVSAARHMGRLLEKYHNLIFEQVPGKPKEAG